MPNNEPMIGESVPNFTLAATGGLSFNLHDYRGKNVVLYFYPKDATPGCTVEAEDFRDHFHHFSQADTVIFGVSRDTIQSHENFKLKKALPFELLADVDQKVCTQFSVIKEKTMFGKTVRGIERSTFLLDRQGVLRQAWRKVKVPGHVAEVLACAQKLT